MDENNRFLNSYKKKMEDEATAPAQAPAASPPESAPQTLRYEESSGFVKPHQAGRDRMPPPRRPNYLAPIIVGAVVVVGVIVGLLLFFNRGAQMIDFTGWTANDAQLWAKEKGINLQVAEQYNDQAESGKVISQDPQKGTTVSKGGFVRITVSKGHDLTQTLELPDLMRMSKDEIDAWAAKNFMAKVRITAEYSESVAEGRVVSFEINDSTVVGNTVARNTPIYIVISKGSENTADVLIAVPDFKTKTVSESYAFAKENGVELQISEQYDDYAAKGAIIAQSVKANEKVRKGDKITLTVSKGKQIIVPDFSDYSKAKAQAEATQLGIPASIVEKYSSKAAGSFVSQSLEAGSEYKDGDVLELLYSLGNKVVIGSFVGQMRDAMDAWAKELNDQGASIVIKATYTQNSAAAGTIIWQSKKNATIGVKTTISITISQGKAAFMPDFVAPDGSGYDLAITRTKALDLCEGTGIIPVFTAEAHAGRLPGEIWSQSIAAGAEVAEGTTVILKYVPANVQVSVPDFTGMTKAEVLAGGYLSRFDITFTTNETHVDGYADQIYQQSLLADTTVASGSAITLKISPP